MKDRDHNEAMAGMFQAEPQFAADYLRQVLADGETCGRARRLAANGRCAACQPGRPPTDSAPSAGLFDRAGVRYEVACDVIGALIAHYAEIMGREREQAQPNEAVLRVAGAMKAALAGERMISIRATAPASRRRFSRYAPLARRLYGPDENDHARQEQRRVDFDQVNASLALDGLAMSADDLAVQALLIRGDITHDEAVQCYRILHRHAQ